MDNIIVYDNYDGYGEMSLWGPSNILILKSDWEHPENNSYENYFTGSSSILGKWEVKGDTLYLFPLYNFKYDSIPQIVKMDANNPKYFEESWINQKWLIKDDCIYEKTDFSLFNEYDEDGNLGWDANEHANRNNYLRLRSKTKLK